MRGQDAQSRPAGASCCQSSGEAVGDRCVASASLRGSHYGMCTQQRPTMREAAHDLTVAAALSKLARPRCSEPPSWCPLLPAQWGGRGGAMCRVSIAQGQRLRDVHSATATMREAAHDLTVAAALRKLARPRCSEPPSWCPLLPVQWGGRGEQCVASASLRGSHFGMCTQQRQRCVRQLMT